MMIEYIKEIINPKVVLPINEHPVKQICLKENSSESDINKLYIKKLPSEVFAFTLDYDGNKSDKDKYKQLSCYLNKSKKNINKSCDLVIVFCKEESNDVSFVLLDLKSKKQAKQKAKIQLDNSERFLSYILSLVDPHYNENTYNIDFKKIVVFTGRSLPKRETYRDRKTDESPRYISCDPQNGSANIYFGALI